MKQRTSPRRRRQRTDRRPKSHVQDPILSRFHAHAAGIDVGASAHWVAVPADQDEQPVRRFGTFTADLYAIAQWLEQCHIQTVVMESTDIYVRRITARAISLAERTGSEGNPWVND